MDESPVAPRPVRRATIANLGCKVNQAEMDAVERLLRARDVDLVDSHQAADLVVVNTCTVTSIADQKSRQAVRRARRTSPSAQVLVTGCSVAVDPESLAAADPEARLFDNESKGRLLAELENLVELPEGAELPSLSGVEPAVEMSRSVGLEVDEGSVEDAFEREIDRTRVFVKIQDGCSFHCTYCIIPRARGPERSTPAQTVLAEVRRATSAGHREVVLTGINAGAYGGDDGLAAAGGTSDGPGLAGLVRRILAETEVERIRLSSIEPQHVTDDLLDVWAGSAGRCLPHFHVPLQSGDDTILRRMGRRYDAASYAELVGRVRRTIPGVAVHADLIVGFPGEDDAAWARTAAFLQDLDLAGIHVFRYSARPGTPAARMIGQVDGRTKKRRSAEALALAAEARARFATRQLGGESRVLFERQLPDGRWLGHAENHVLVSATAAGGSSLENAVGLVRAESIDTAAPDRIVGRLLAIDPPRSPGRIQLRPQNPWQSRPSCSKIDAATRIVRTGTIRECAMPSDCLFCRIVAGELPAAQIHADESVVAIRDISPQAPTHILLLSRKHIASVREVGPADRGLIDKICAVATELATREGIAQDGYRLVVNVGRNGGQTVDHLHVHMLGGRPMAWPPG